MTKLSVNVNKWATLRNARGGNNPDVLKAAKACLDFGAAGITVHPRPDERHIRKTDVDSICNLLRADYKNAEFNIEGYPSQDFIQMVLEVKPDQVTLVPDPPEVLTSNAGWDTLRHETFLKEINTRFQSAGIRVSLFSWTDAELIKGAKETGADRIELYTEAYANEYPGHKEKAIASYRSAAKLANEIGLGINAGHDLSLENLKYFHQEIPELLEVSIGHALVCDAINLGLKETIRRYLHCLE